MRRIKLIVAYDGTEYSGWQIQPEAPTIEMCLDKAIRELTGENVHVTGASRTDAGVHAYGNVAVFDTESTIPGDRFTFALNTAVPLPQKRNFTWHVTGSIDIEKMKEAAAYIVGEHDFKSFCCVRTQAESTVRTIYSLEVLQEGSEIIIRIKGNGFLYNMVRIITGTLIQVGKGRFKPEYVKQMLEAKDRTVAGQTAPPQGLTLVGIEYVDNDDARVV